MGNKQGHELSPEEKQRLKEEKKLLKEDKERKKRLRKVESKRLKEAKKKGSSTGATPATEKKKKKDDDSESVGGSSVWSEKSVGSAPDSWYHSASEPGSKRSSIYLPASAGPGYYQHDCWYSGYGDSGSEKSKPSSRAGSRAGSRPPSRTPSVKDTLNVLRSSSLERYPLGVPKGEVIDTPLHKAGSLDMKNVVATNFMENREQVMAELDVAAAIASRYDEAIRSSKDKLEKTSIDKTHLLDKASLIDKLSLTDRVSLTSSVYHSAEEGSIASLKRKVMIEDRESLSSVYYSADEGSITSKRRSLDYASDHTSATGSIYYSADEGGSVAGTPYYTATSGSEVEDHVTDAEILGKERPSPPSKPVAVDREGSALSRLAYIKVENDALLLHWETPDSDGGTPISGYILERCEGEGDQWVRVNLVRIKDTEYAVANLIGGRDYRFRVSAENAVGVSDPSEVSEVVSISTDQEATEPHFLKELRDVTAVEGHRVEFVVDCIGTPLPDITWFKDGYEIYDTKRYEFLIEGDRYTLVLKEAKVGDEGDIRVRATNRVGVAASQAVLHIEAPPSIQLSAQYEQGLIFDTDELIRLRIPYVGRPQPEAIWSHNGRQIELDERHTMDVSEKYITLKIGGANRNDKGMYSVSLTNPQGTTNASFFVTVTDRPGVPGKPILTDISGSSVTLRWDAPQDDGGCRISNYTVEYFRVGWDVWLKGASSRITWTQMSDLIVGSEYRFRVKAENAYGVSDAGEECEPILIDEAKSPGSGSFDFETYKSTTAVGSSLPKDTSTLLREETSSFEYGSSEIGSSEGGRDSDEKVRIHGLGVSDEAESSLGGSVGHEPSLDLGSSSEKPPSFEYGASMERGESYEMGDSMEREASHKIGASMEKEAAYEMGASMERGASYEMGASMERGASYEMGSSMERGASYDLGSSLERDSSVEGPEARGYTFEHYTGSLELGDSDIEVRRLGPIGESMEYSSSPGGSLDIGGSVDSDEPPMLPPRVPRRGGRSPAPPPSMGSGWSPTPVRRKKRTKSTEVLGEEQHSSMDYDDGVDTGESPIAPLRRRRPGSQSSLIDYDDGTGTGETPSAPLRRRRPGSQSSLIDYDDGTSTGETPSAPLRRRRPGSQSSLIETSESVVAGESTSSSKYVTETATATSSTADYESAPVAPDSTPSPSTTIEVLPSARMEAVTVAAGGEAVLVVSLEGIQVANISWQKGGRDLVAGPHYTTTQTQKAAQLIIHGATNNDSGTYTALVTKPDGSQARAAVALQVASLSSPTKIEAPIFVRSLSDLAAKVGTRVRFLVELRQAHDVKVYWSHNNTEVAEDPRYRILHEGNFFCIDISPLTVDDEGPWRCLAENSFGQASSSASLRVIVPKGYKKPVFLEELEAILTVEGTVSLECKVVGVPTPVLRWFKDGNEIKAGDVFALSANPDDPTSLGTYTCEAVNCMGRAISSSRVRVVSRESSLRPSSRTRRSPTPVGPPPVILEEITDKKVKVGEKIRLIVKVQTPPEVISIAWYNNGKKIEASEKYRLSDEGGGKYMIEVMPAELGDDGEWKAVVKNEGGYTSSTCKIILTVPRNYRGPRFLDDLRAVLTDEGLVSFECKVVGYPTPVLQWFKDGQELKPGDVYQLSGTNSLGKYSCIAKNCMGEAQSSAELTLEDIKSHLNEEEKEQLLATNIPPRFIQGLRSRDIKIGDPVRLTVQVTMTPPPEVTWYREDEVIVESSKYHLSKNEPGYFHLDIGNLEIEDQGEWKCVSSNDFGHSVTAASLKLVIPRHYKKPVFLEPLRAVLSPEGTVNLECKVIGVPQPVLKWFKDGTELKPGDIHRIISGEDGTCCLGTYTCEAINVLGSASSSAALLGFEDKLIQQKEGEKIAAAMADARGGIVKNPSLSTINEEHTSQISVYESAISEVEGGKADVSVSIDGREVSLSLYDTPDISEAEAKQIAEIYADEISDRMSLSAHENNAELPPLRFTRETKRKGPLVLEAMVIDVEDQPFEDYISMADVQYDDTRTEAGVEELSAMEAVVIEDHEALCSDIADIPDMEVWNEEHISARTISMEPKGIAHISEQEAMQNDLKSLSEQGLSMLKTHAQEMQIGVKQTAIAEETQVMTGAPKSLVGEKAKKAKAEAKAVPGLSVAQTQEKAVLTSLEKVKAQKAQVKRSIEAGEVAVTEEQQFLSGTEILPDEENIDNAQERYPSFLAHEAVEIDANEAVEQVKSMSSEERPSKKLKKASVKKSEAVGAAAIVESPDVHEGEAKPLTKKGLKGEKATVVQSEFESCNIMSADVMEDVASLEAQGMVAQHARVKDPSQKEALKMEQADVRSGAQKGKKIKKSELQKAQKGKFTSTGETQDESFFTATQDIPESFRAEETEADFSEMHSLQTSEQNILEQAQIFECLTPEQQMAIQSDPNLREALAISIKEGLSQADVLTLMNEQQTQAYAQQMLHEAVVGYEQVGISSDVGEMPEYAQGLTDRANILPDATREAVMIQEADVDYANLNVFNKEDMSQMLTVAEEKSGSLVECIVVQEADLQAEAAIVSQRPAAQPEKAVAGIVEGVAESATVGEPPFIAGKAGGDKKRPAKGEATEVSALDETSLKKIKLEDIELKDEEGNAILTSGLSPEEIQAKKDELRAKLQNLLKKGEEELMEMEEETQSIETTGLSPDEIQAKKDELRAKLQKLRERKEAGLIRTPSSESLTESVESEEAKRIKAAEMAKSKAKDDVESDVKGEKEKSARRSASKEKEKAKSEKRGKSEEKAASQKRDKSEEKSKRGKSQEKSAEEGESTGTSLKRRLSEKFASLKKGPSKDNVSSEDGVTSPKRGASQEKSIFKRGPSAEKSLSPKRGPSQEKTISAPGSPVPDSEGEQPEGKKKKGLFAGMKSAISSKVSEIKTAIVPGKPETAKVEGVEVTVEAEVKHQEEVKKAPAEPSEEKQSDIVDKDQVKTSKVSTTVCESTEVPIEKAVTTDQKIVEGEVITIVQESTETLKEVSHKNKKATENLEVSDAQQEALKSVTPSQTVESGKDVTITHESAEALKESSYEVQQAAEKMEVSGAHQQVSESITTSQKLAAEKGVTITQESTEALKESSHEVQQAYEKLEISGAQQEVSESITTSQKVVAGKTVTITQENAETLKDRYEKHEATEKMEVGGAQQQAIESVTTSQKVESGKVVTITQESAESLKEVSHEEQQALEKIEVSGAQQQALDKGSIAAKKEEILARKQELLAKQEAAMQDRGISEEPSSEISTASGSEIDSVLEFKETKKIMASISTEETTTANAKLKKKLMAGSEVYEESEVSTDANIAIKKTDKPYEKDDASADLSMKIKPKEEETDKTEIAASQKDASKENKVVDELDSTKSTEEQNTLQEKAADIEISTTEGTDVSKTVTTEKKIGQSETKKVDEKDKDKKAMSPEAKDKKEETGFFKGLFKGKKRSSIKEDDVKAAKDKAKSPEPKTDGEKQKTKSEPENDVKQESKEKLQDESKESEDKENIKKQATSELKDKENKKAKSPEPKIEGKDMKDDKKKSEIKDKEDQNDTITDKIDNQKSKQSEPKEEKKEAKEIKKELDDKRVKASEDKVKGKAEHATEEEISKASKVEIEEIKESKSSVGVIKDATDKKAEKEIHEGLEKSDISKTKAEEKIEELNKAEYSNKKGKEVTTRKSPEPKDNKADKTKSTELKDKESKLSKSVEPGDKEIEKAKSPETKEKDTKKAKSPEPKDEAKRAKSPESKADKKAKSPELKDEAKKAKSPEPKEKDTKKAKSPEPKDEAKRAKSPESKADKKAKSPETKDEAKKAKSPEPKEKDTKKAKSPESKDEAKKAKSPEPKDKDAKKTISPEEKESSKVKSPEPKDEEAKKLESAEPKDKEAKKPISSEPIEDKKPKSPELKDKEAEKAKSTDLKEKESKLIKSVESDDKEIKKDKSSEPKEDVKKAKSPEPKEAKKAKSPEPKDDKKAKSESKEESSKSKYSEPKDEEVKKSESIELKDKEAKKAKSPEPTEVKKAKSPEPKDAKKAKSPESKDEDAKKAKSPEPKDAKKAKSPEPKDKDAKKAKSPEPKAKDAKKAKSPEPKDAKKAKSPEPKDKDAKKAKSPEPKDANKAKSPESKDKDVKKAKSPEPKEVSKTAKSPEPKDEAKKSKSEEINEKSRVSEEDTKKAKIPEVKDKEEDKKAKSEVELDSKKAKEEAKQSKSHEAEEIKEEAIKAKSTKKEEDAKKAKSPEPKVDQKDDVKKAKSPESKTVKKTESELKDTEVEKPKTAERKVKSPERKEEKSEEKSRKAKSPSIEKKRPSLRRKSSTKENEGESAEKADGDTEFKERERRSKSPGTRLRKRSSVKESDAKDADTTVEGEKERKPSLRLRKKSTTKDDDVSNKEDKAKSPDAIPKKRSSLKKRTSKSPETLEKKRSSNITTDARENSTAIRGAELRQQEELLRGDKKRGDLRINQERISRDEEDFKKLQDEDKAKKRSESRREEIERLNREEKEIQERRRKRKEEEDKRRLEDLEQLKLEEQEKSEKRKKEWEEVELKRKAEQELEEKEEKERKKRLEEKRKEIEKIKKEEEARIEKEEAERREKRKQRKAEEEKALKEQEEKYLKQEQERMEKRRKLKEEEEKLRKESEEESRKRHEMEQEERKKKRQQEREEEERLMKEEEERRKERKRQREEHDRKMAEEERQFEAERKKRVEREKKLLQEELKAKEEAKRKKEDELRLQGEDFLRKEEERRRKRMEDRKKMSEEDDSYYKKLQQESEERKKEERKKREIMYTEKELISAERYGSLTKKSLSSTSLDSETFHRRDPRRRPKFSTKLQDRQIAKGTRVRMSCNIISALDEDAPEVEWFKGGLPITIDERYRFEIHEGVASLEINHSCKSDSGEYTCTAKNHHGRVSTTCDLRVKGDEDHKPSPPTFTTSLRDRYIIEDDELILTCHVMGHPEPKITWLKDADKLPPSQRFQTSITEEGICKLIITSPRSADSGTYTCHAENRVYRDEISANIQVQDIISKERKNEGVQDDSETPRFVSELCDQYVEENGTLTLQVEVAGSPPPDVLWLFNGRSLHASGKFRISASGNTHTLTVFQVTPKDIGTYSCRITNRYGYSYTMSSVYFGSPKPRRGAVVKGADMEMRAPMFTERPESMIVVYKDEEIKLSCTVAGEPTPRITWLKGSRDVANTTRATKSVKDNCHTLVIRGATFTDSGTYTAEAKNSNGTVRAYCSIKVREMARSRSFSPRGQDEMFPMSDYEINRRKSGRFIRDVPGKCGVPGVHDIGKNWVSLHWTKPESTGVVVTAYKVESWILGEEARWTDCGVSPIPSFDVYHLKQDREYLFRITPRNKYGWGEPQMTPRPIRIGRKIEHPDFPRCLPHQVRAMPGGTISLDAQITGDPMPEIKWYKDGTLVDVDRYPRFNSLCSEGTISLRIEDLKWEDEGKYELEVLNPGGRVTSSTRVTTTSDCSILDAQERINNNLMALSRLDSVSAMAPQFTMRLRDRRVQVGFPVRLTCQIVGIPKPDVAWYKDDEKIEVDDCHTIWQEDGHFYTLEISNSIHDDAAIYSALASNQYGSVLCRCRLIVDSGLKSYVSPMFLRELEDQNVRENETITLQTVIEAYPTIGVVWHRDGQRIRPSRKHSFSLDADGIATLLIRKADYTDGGLYTCTAANEIGHIESMCRVSVSCTDADLASGRRKISKIWQTNEPMFVRKPRIIEAEVGDLVIIECEVSGDPRPTVSWLHDWIKPGEITESGRFQEIGTGPVYRLEIPNCRLEDTGAYSILAKNDHGETRAVVSVQVYNKGLKGELDGIPIKRGVMEYVPVVQRPLQDVRCCDGDSVTLEALVEAPKNSTIRWEKQGKLLKLDGDIQSEWDGSRVRLKIREVFPEDEGEYSCIILNDMGKAVTSATLIVEMADDKENDVTVQMEHRPDMSRRTTPSRTNTPTRFSRSPSVGVGFQREGSAHSWAGVGWREPSVSVSHWRPLSRGSSPLLLGHRYTPEPSTRSKRSHRPKFYYIPHDRIVEEGETVSFQCAVKGTPIPRSSWDKDNIKIYEGGRMKMEERDEVRTLEISKVTQQDAGLYRVTIENDLGREQATARLDVIKTSGNKYSGYVRTWDTSPVTAPRFARRMYTTSVNDGTRLTLKTEFRGSPVPRTKWYRNNELLPLCDDFPQTCNGRIATLEIPEVTTADAGTYTCVIVNSVGKAECSCEVTVESRKVEENTPPFFIRGLKDFTVLDGDEVRLTVKVGGSLPMKVLWVYNDKEIKASKDFRYEEEGNGCFSLFMREVYPDDAGIYFCEAYNLHGDAHSYCRMSIHDPNVAKSSTPRIVGNLTPLEVEEGSAARFSINVHGHPTPTVTWFCDGRKLTSTPRIKIDVDDDVGPEEGHKHTLSILHALSTDSGVISVVATNCIGTDTASTTLKVNVYAPLRENRLRSPTTTTNVNANNSTLISQQQSRFTPPRTSNSPAPRIKPMLKEITNIGTSSVDSAYGTNSLRDSSGCSSSLSNVSELEFDSATKEYLQNEMSQKHLHKVESYVEEEEPEDIDDVDDELQLGYEAESEETGAEILTGPMDVTVLKGQSATLTATYTGKPEPLVSWFKKDQEITDGGRYSVKIENGISTLTIHDIVQEDCDKYTVDVRNSLGAHRAFASLAVGSAPEPPADRPNLSEVTADSVTLSWYGPTYDGGSVVTGYIVEAHKIGNGDWSTLISGCHSTSYIAQGLDTNCQYEFRVRAQNIHGVSEPSKPSIPVTTSVPADKNDEPEIEDHDTTFAPLNVKVESGSDFDLKYKMHEEVGKGRFGIVYRVTLKENGVRRAAKVIKCIKQSEKEKVREEISIMNLLRHPKLLQLGAAYEKQKEMIMVMEYISGGELFERVVADDFALTERDCILFIRQICEGVQYMHKNNILHLDLKPENILCVRRTSHQIKLIDFGLARRFNPDDPLKVLFGTPEFIAPEIINYEHISFTSDMWSVGVICYVLLSGLSPFMGDNDFETFSNITLAEFDFDDDAFTAITEDAKDFIRSLLIKKKEKRLTAEECFKHPWLAQTEEDMNKVVLSTDKLKKFIIRRKWQDKMFSKVERHLL